MAAEDSVNIFNYTNYIEYLNDWFKAKKASQPNYSYQMLANKAGFKSRSFMQFVMRAERPLNLKTIPKVTLALNLNKSQAQYFEAMVFFKESKDHETRLRYWEVMKKLGKSSKIIQLQSTQFEYLKDWYLAPLREVICKVDFKNDYAYLGRLLLPSISSAKAKDAVQTLSKLKLVKRKGAIYKAMDKHIQAFQLVQSLAIRNFQKQAFLLGNFAHERIPKEQRDLSTITLSSSEDGFEKIKKLAKEFRKDVLKIVEESDSYNRVFQLNLQFFPVSVNLDKL